MIRKAPRDKKCRQCGKPFKPYTSTQIVCELNCALEYNRQKAIDDKVKTFKENLKNHGYWTKVLQAVFNTYIRLRDAGKPCICCGKPLGKVYHAGHFWSTGAYPGLRIDEDNCHGQREDCNLHLHGNHAEYAIRLPQRIGQEKFDELYQRKKEVVKLSIPEIQEKIIYYKQKIKTLKTL